MPAEVATPVLIRSDRVVLGLAAALAVFAGLAHFGSWNAVVTFVVAAGAVAVLAALVGRSVEQLGDRFGPGATGVLQSALGNLPELFICIFSLKAGLVDVVRAALVGSILANLVLVLGLAFLVGGLKHGPQQLGSERARTITVLMVLSVAALAIPSLAALLLLEVAAVAAVAAAAAAARQRPHRRRCRRREPRRRRSDSLRMPRPASRHTAIHPWARISEPRWARKRTRWARPCPKSRPRWAMSR